MKILNGDYKSFVFDFHKKMLDNKITLVYEGEVNQTITKAFSSLTERSMNEDNVSSGSIKRVYHVMVECLQNICKHADDAEMKDNGLTGNGIFVVGQSEDSYTITTGNNVSNSRIDELSEMLNKLNKMDRNEVKEFYKKAILDSKLSDRGGAGLGFIDIVKRTGNEIDFHFEPIDDNTSFFILVSKINK